MFTLGMEASMEEELTFGDLMKQAEIATEMLDLEKAVRLYD